MNKLDELKLRKKYLAEINRLDRINKLCKKNNVKEFIELLKLDVEDISKMDEYDILMNILEDFEVKKTNNIYVCTGAYCIGFDPYYGEDGYFEKNISFDSPLIEYKRYKNIEDLLSKDAYVNVEDFHKYTDMSVKEFERENTVLNPLNVSDNSNGFDNVRNDFFMETLKTGQGNAKKFILKKYPRI